MGAVFVFCLLFVQSAAFPLAILARDTIADTRLRELEGLSDRALDSQNVASNLLQIMLDAPRQVRSNQRAAGPITQRGCVDNSKDGVPRNGRYRYNTPSM